MNELNSYIKHTEERIVHWDKIHHMKFSSNLFRYYYHDTLTKIYKSLIPPNKKVLEVGCGQGSLLESLKPSRGVGVDFSKVAIDEASKRYPALHFICTDAHKIDLAEKFDYVILSDALNELWDVQTVFDRIYAVCTPDTRIIINTYSHLWDYPLKIASNLGLTTPRLTQNWLTVDDTAEILYLSRFELIRRWEEFLLPFPIPLLHKLCNRFLVKLWPFSILALTNFIIARPIQNKILHEPSVSVIIPARNEEGNIADIFKRTPIMGGGTELIFVEGHSTDNTYIAIENAIPECTKFACRLLRQPGKGKGDAVRYAFEHASGDILMILDADLAVPPEILSRFYNALCSGQLEFANGVRLVYPMEDKAMRFINLLGNKFFSIMFTWILGQKVKDTLCGTKALWKKDYEKIAAGRKYFGDFDPFGDFDLLFGATRLNLKLGDIPVRYHERTYGKTNINRWRHGVLLLRMMAFAAIRIKFL